MGIAGDSQDERIIREPVHHFIKFPSDDAICIVMQNKREKASTQKGR